MNSRLNERTPFNGSARTPGSYSHSTNGRQTEPARRKKRRSYRGMIREYYRSLEFQSHALLHHSSGTKQLKKTVGKQRRRERWKQRQRKQRQRPELKKRRQTEGVKVGTWNVRGMASAEKLWEVSQMAKFWKLDVLLIQETMRSVKGSTDDLNGYTFWWEPCSVAGLESKRGVGIAIRTKFHKEMGNLSPNFVNDRIVEVILKSGKRQMSIIGAYAPTNDKKYDEDATSFFTSLSTTIRKVPARDMLIMAGDLNARVPNWSDKIVRLDGAGVAPGEADRNGTLMYDLATNDKLMYMNANFVKTKYGTKSFTIKGERKWFTYDQVWCRQAQSTAVMDTKVVTYGKNNPDELSDHRAVRCTVKFNRRKFNKRDSVMTKRTVRIDGKKLLEKTVKEGVYEIIKNSLQVIERHRQETELGPAVTSQSSLETFIDLAMQVSREWAPQTHKPKKNKSWFDEDREVLEPVWNRKQNAYFVFKTNGFSLKHKATWKAAGKVWDSTVKLSKARFFSMQATKLKELKKRNEMALYHSTLKQAKLEQKAKDGRTTVYDLNGKILFDAKAVLNRTTEHHASIIGSSRKSWKKVNMKELYRTVNPLPLCEWLARRISVRELRIAVARMKLGKAPGPGGEPTELIRILLEVELEMEYGSEIVDRIVIEINGILLSGGVPQFLKDATLINLFKNKGDPKDCNNYRAIALLSHVAKLVSIILVLRLEKHVEDIGILPEEQCGFRRNRGTTDMLFVTRFLAELTRRGKKEFYSVYVDLTKAYDSVNREALWAILKRIGVPPKVVAVIRDLHDNMKARVCVDGKLGEWFEVTQGLRQGCVLATLLFNIFFAFVIKHAENALDEQTTDGYGVRLTHTSTESGSLFETPKDRKKSSMAQFIKVWIALYADDAAMMTDHSKEELQMMMTAFNNATEIFGLTVSIKKTEVIAPAGTNILIAGICLKNVDKFKYLGAQQTLDGKSDTEILSRIRNCKFRFSDKRQMFRNRSSSFVEKKLWYDTYILSALLYGCETWTTDANLFRKLESCNLKHLRQMYGKYWDYNISYASRLKKTGMVTIESLVRQRRLNWLGKMAKMNDLRLPKKVMYSILTHQPEATGTTMDFRTCIRKDLKEFGLTTGDDLDSWLEKASSKNWEDDVLEGRKAFMIKFHEEEDRKSTVRALLELPLFPANPNKDSMIAASYLRFLQELPYFDDPAVTMSNRQALRELPLYPF